MSEDSNIPKSFYRVGVVPVIRRGRRILLGQRLKHDEAYGKWVFSGGGLEAGETFVEGVKREGEEETGLHLNVGKLIMATRSPHAGRMNVALIYWAYPTTQDERPLATREIGNPRFFTLREAERLDLMPATRDVLAVIGPELRNPFKRFVFWWAHLEDPVLVGGIDYDTELSMP